MNALSPNLHHLLINSLKSRKRTDSSAVPLVSPTPKPFKDAREVGAIALADAKS